MITECPLCFSSRNVCFKAKVLNKYEVNYFYCDNCGLLQTEPPYWLDEAYTNAIAESDTGLVSRNIVISKKLAFVLFFLLDRGGKYIDIAGGYGLLTRLMRDIGFDFYWSDSYCENIFAKGFELSTTKGPFTAITAFEVLEHVPDPVKFIQQSLSEAETSTIIFSTELFERSPLKPEAWWYYALNTGQHISFYQQKSLEFLGKRLSLSSYSHKYFHMLTDKRISHHVFKFLSGSLSNLLFEYVRRNMKSKTFSDHEKVTINGVNDEGII